MPKTCPGACLALVTLTLSLPLWAQERPPEEVPPTVTSGSQNDTKIFVGLNWNFGVRNGLTAVAGVRWAHATGRNHVDGALIDMTVPLTGAPFGIGEVHLKGLAGTRATQGELGAGYAFQSQSWLVNAALRVPYGTVGSDYLVDKGWLPYVGVDSLKKTRSARQTATCPAGYFFDIGGQCEND